MKYVIYLLLLILTMGLVYSTNVPVNANVIVFCYNNVSGQREGTTGTVNCTDSTMNVDVATKAMTQKAVGIFNFTLVGAIVNDYYTCQIDCGTASSIDFTKSFYVQSNLDINFSNVRTEIEAVDNYVDTEVSDILTDTSTTLDDFIDTEINSILIQTNGLKENFTNVSLDLANINSDTRAILVDTNAQDSSDEWAGLNVQTITAIGGNGTKILSNCSVTNENTLAVYTWLQVDGNVCQDNELTWETDYQQEFNAVSGVVNSTNATANTINTNVVTSLANENTIYLGVQELNGTTKGTEMRVGLVSNAVNSSTLVESAIWASDITETNYEVRMQYVMDDLFNISHGYGKYALENSLATMSAVDNSTSLAISGNASNWFTSSWQNYILELASAAESTSAKTNDTNDDVNALSIPTVIQIDAQNNQSHGTGNWSAISAGATISSTDKAEIITGASGNVTGKNISNKCIMNNTAFPETLEAQLNCLYQSG